jgi:putative SOS response-associated peptidase YedK
MCVKLRGSGMTPGQIMAFMTKLGKASGIWGFENGSRFNARYESLNDIWNKIQMNRGILTVDSFWEKGKQFVRQDGKLFNIGVIYNPKMEFAVITNPANYIVKPYHDRMPLIISDDSTKKFLELREFTILPEEKFQVLIAA